LPELDFLAESLETEDGVGPVRPPRPNLSPNDVWLSVRGRTWLISTVDGVLVLDPELTDSLELETCWDTFLLTPWGL
jgi:hypothetical protein